MASDNLLRQASNDKDYYALLGDGITKDSTAKQINRAYRRAALKVHPDHNPDDPAAAERFHELSIGHALLTDEAGKERYDNARVAKAEQALRNDARSEKRRRLIEELEEAEGRSRKMQKLDEEMQMRMRAAREGNDKFLAKVMAERRREQEEEESVAAAKLAAEAQAKKDTSTNGSRAAKGRSATALPDIVKTVTVSWKKSGLGKHLDSDTLRKMFTTFGEVEATTKLSSKRAETGIGTDEEVGKKRKMAVFAVVFFSLKSAYRAVMEYTQQSGEEWKILDSVQWAEGTMPGIISQAEDVFWAEWNKNSDIPNVRRDARDFLAASSENGHANGKADIVMSGTSQTKDEQEQQTATESAGDVPVFSSFKKRSTIDDKSAASSVPDTAPSDASHPYHIEMEHLGAQDSRDIEWCREDWARRCATQPQMEGSRRPICE